jgi:hypothetical protein
MENVFERLAQINKPNKASLDKSLIFKRAWDAFKVKNKFGRNVKFSEELAQCYRIAKLIGYENYKASSFELNYR